MTNDWIFHDGTDNNPVREGETLVAVRFQGGSEDISNDAEGWDWSNKYGDYSITHFQVSPPRKAEPATMSADEVLIRAREAVIEAWGGMSAKEIEEIRAGRHDEFASIQVILAYERDRAKPLAEVAPHTAEDPDDRAAYDIYLDSGGFCPWEDRHSATWYRSILAGIKRGRELERGAPSPPDKEI